MQLEGKPSIYSQNMTVPMLKNSLSLYGSSLSLLISILKIINVLSLLFSVPKLLSQ